MEQESALESFLFAVQPEQKSDKRALFDYIRFVQNNLMHFTFLRNIVCWVFVTDGSAKIFMDAHF
jgi:hypothetical protein